MLFNCSDVQIEEKFITKVKDTKKSGVETMEDNLLRKYKQKTGAVIERIAEMGLPKPQEQFRLITRRAFNAIEILQFIVTSETIRQLYMAVYSINYFAAKILLELIDAGKIQNCEIMMSNLRNTAYREKEEIILREFSAHPHIKLWFCCSHAKLTSCETSSGNFYTIEGSGNHAPNSRVEQYVIDNDRDVFDFTAQWMAEMKEFLRGKRELVEV